MAKINQEEYQVLKGLDDKWKWITKDKYSDNPELFQVKPYKSGVVWFWDGHTEVEKIYNNELFQFIQWEDEEPYNIAELIKEYEYKTGTFDWATAFQSAFHGERKETEMKKNKEWAFIELGKLFPSHAEMYDYPDNITVMKCELLNKVYDILSQLDEPEVLSQEFIESNSVYASSDGVTEEYVHVDDLENLLVPTLSEMETVADVVTTFWKSYERLKEVMSMKVEELEE